MPGTHLVIAMAATFPKIEHETEVNLVILGRGEHAATPIPPCNEWTSVLNGTQLHVEWPTLAQMRQMLEAGLPDLPTGKGPKLPDPE